MPEFASTANRDDTLNAATAAPTSTSPELVGPLPPCPPLRMEPKRIPLVLGLVGTWFAPRRFGPHLAAGSWRAAIGAHVVGLLAALILFPLLGYRAAPDDSFGWVIESLLRGGEERWDLISGFFGSAQNVLSAFAGLLVIELCLMGATLSLMPWAAVGERIGLLVSRCVRWVLWTSSLALPLLVFAHSVASVCSRVRGVSFEEVMGRGPLDAPFFVLAVYLCCWWILWVMFRGLLDYAGPERGPAWEPIEPICEGCGYSLTMQPVNGVCPECATPIQESLPNRMQRETLRGPRHETREARRSCIRSLLVSSLAVHLFLPLVATVLWFVDSEFAPLKEVVSVAMAAGAFLSALMLCAFGVGCTLCLAAGWWSDRQRDLRVAATTSLYCIALGIPAVVYAVLAVAVYIGLESMLILSQGARDATVFDIPLERYYVIAQGIIALLCLVWLILRIRRRFQRVRYTNT